MYNMLGEWNENKEWEQGFEGRNPRWTGTWFQFFVACLAMHNCLGRNNLSYKTRGSVIVGELSANKDKEQWKKLK